MTGIFSNDIYNNGVTRDNYDQYAHTFDSNARYDNFPPSEDHIPLHFTKNVNVKKTIIHSVLGAIGFFSAIMLTTHILLLFLIQ